ncbi:hypothetical protein C9374_005829 [Naegleria lovaniensis]|uniref:NAD(P)-binding protein n=1 Tax=Naegleria lovaniensis TaxID=51637 RepID=A0AA88KIB7_NAELO|nr:uncharacterized protein C9374_005829 [Naegleria lovaniensis]KAG2382037.1 hypothetical protein C9374_005829 [Naegleria lovaniensis]
MNQERQDRFMIRSFHHSTIFITIINILILTCCFSQVHALTPHSIKTLLIPKQQQQEPLHEFANKVVYVSGGSSGIGFATSLLFAQQGARVVFTARDFHPDWYTGAEAEMRINSDAQVIQSGGKALFVKCNVANYTEVREVIFGKIDKVFGRLDIAVNNAGIGGPSGNLVDLDPKYFHNVHDPLLNNAYGVLYQMKAQLEYWKSKKDNSTTKSIVNLTSYNGLRACPGCSMYSASKHAIIGLTQSVALEHIKATQDMPRVRVNALAPGLIDTPLTRNQAKTLYEGVETWIGPLITENNPLWLKMKPELEKELAGGRLGRPEEMAHVILYLSSEVRASYVSGTVVSADNGDTTK